MGQIDYSDLGLIDWINYPNTTTPLNQINLRKINHAIQTLVTALNEKAEQTALTSEASTRETVDATKQSISGTQTWVSDITWNASNGTFTITRVNGTSFIVDTKLEKLAVNFTYVSDPLDSHYQSLEITLDDGTKQYVDMSALVTQYEFSNSLTVQMLVDEDGKVTANIVNHSIGANQLETNYLARVTQQATNANNSANSAYTSSENAHTSEVNADASAQASEEYAGTSEAYAIGKRGGTDVTNSDPAFHNNAKYWAKVAQQEAESVGNIISPKGTITFAQLPALADTRKGDMYNISDAFTSTSDFKDGAGKKYPAGSNVYCAETEAHEEMSSEVKSSITQSGITIDFYDDNNNYCKINGSNSESSVIYLPIYRLSDSELTGTVKFTTELSGEGFAFCGIDSNDELTHLKNASGMGYVGPDGYSASAETIEQYSGGIWICLRIPSGGRLYNNTVVTLWLENGSAQIDIAHNKIIIAAGKHWDVMSGIGSFSELNDVAFESLADGQVPVWDNTLHKWVNGSGADGVEIPYYPDEATLDDDWANIDEGGYAVTPDEDDFELEATAIDFDPTGTDLDSVDVGGAIIEVYTKTKLLNALGQFTFNSNTVKALNITNGEDAKSIFGMTEKSVDINDTEGSVVYDAKKGHCGTVNGANAVVTLDLEAKAMYVLFCSSYTLSNGNLYGATARLLTAHGLATGTPNNVSLGQTSNAPATISLVANNKLTIKNGNAGRATQYNLIRII